jgi:hypothetical protein
MHVGDKVTATFERRISIAVNSSHERPRRHAAERGLFRDRGKAFPG